MLPLQKGWSYTIPQWMNKSKRIEMKLIIVLLGLSLALCANESNKPLDITQPHKISEHQELSDKEKKYQAYQKQLEEENQRLEDDGFCSCNNN